jgi:hypothetical protein
MATRVTRGGALSFPPRAWPGLVGLLAFLAALSFAPPAAARVGLAEWRIELPGGLVVCHGDEAPDACGAVCIYDPRTQALAVADVDDFKIYDGVVVGSTTHGEYFLLDEPTRAVTRFAKREDLARATALRAPVELGRLPRLVMVYGAYSLVSLALVCGLFAALGRRTRRERPIERRIGVYLCASAMTPPLGALGFLVIPYLDQDWPGWELFTHGELLFFYLLLHYLPALIGVGLCTATAIPVTVAGVHLAPRLRIPPRWTWLVSYAVCHAVVLRLTVGEYLLRFNPYWRGGF